MSGSGKPGHTFIATVTKSRNGTATIAGEEEDIVYLVPANKYVFNVTPAPVSGSSSGDESAPDPNA